jgi:predicted nuclease of predicted toxin-antitoxin system
MKLLFDENLSHRLAIALADLFPGSVHVRGVGLKAAEDTPVWEYAREHGFAIISKDGDFQQRSFLYGHPPKVISGRVGNCSTGQIESLVRQHFAEILTFEQDPDGALLVLS